MRRLPWSAWKRPTKTNKMPKKSWIKDLVAREGGDLFSILLLLSFPILWLLSLSRFPWLLRTPRSDHRKGKEKCAKQDKKDRLKSYPV